MSEAAAAKESEQKREHAPAQPENLTTFLNPWATLSPFERHTFACMAVCFFLTVGGYWLIRPMKMGVYIALVGLNHEPKAKMGTVFILIPLLMGYNRLVQKFDSPPKLVACVAGFYGAFFLFISVALGIPGIGMGTEPSATNWLGWITYWTIESYGSVCVAMYWSVVASIANSTNAVYVYPVLVMVSQLGAVGGATVATYTATLGFSFLFFAQAVNVVVCILTVMHVFSRGGLTKPTPEPEVKPKTGSKPPPTGLLEGVRLVAANKYVVYVAVVSTFSEIVGTILDYQMKVLARAEYASPEEFSSFMGHFGQAVNLTSLFFAITGTKRVIQFFGLRLTLLAFPLATLLVILAVLFFPSLWVLFLAMVSMKALGYSLNNPSKEMLYIRTSKDVKFKAKSWIDMFGTRGAKATGSFVNQLFKDSAAQLLTMGSIVGGFFVLVWLNVARLLGDMYDDYVERDIIVGAEEVKKPEEPLV